MKTVLIKNGLLLSPVNGWTRKKGDILIQNGRIVSIREKISEEETECFPERIVDAKGCVVTPGFIDIHTHCYPKAFLGMAPDTLGIERGATTIVDAGSSGADTYEDFRTNYIETSRTKVFTLLNCSKEGLLYGHELDTSEKMDIGALKRTVEKYSDNIVGLKVRASASVVGEMGMEPVSRSARMSKELKKPLTVHVGNAPPKLPEVLKLLGKGDVVTHAFHGKKGGLLTEKETIIQEALEARERGVLFDVGHGVASFSFRVFEKALLAGFDCDMISTDLHIENYEGPVINIASVMSKMIGLGESLEDVVTKCTSVPARHYGLDGLGELAPGFIGDVNIIQLKNCQETAVDSVGDTLEIAKKIVVKKSIYSRGDESEIFEHTIGK